MAKSLGVRVVGIGAVVVAAAVILAACNEGMEEPVPSTQMLVARDAGSKLGPHGEMAALFCDD